MNNLPISSKFRSTPDLPIADAERESLVARLNQAFSDGNVDSESYHAHLDRLFAARTLGELVPVVEVLPPLQTYDQPAVVVQETNVGPGELVPARAVSNKTVVVVTAGILTVVALVLLLVLLI